MKILALSILMLTAFAINVNSSYAVECFMTGGGEECPSEKTSSIKPFQKIPFVGAGELSTQSYANALYRLAIGLAAVLTVIMLIWAGVQYMLSEVVTDKAAAKKTIQNSLLGLLIILSATLLLRTINPNLVELNFLKNASNTKEFGTVDKPPVTTPDNFGPGMMINYSGKSISAAQLKKAREQCLRHSNAEFRSDPGNGIVHCSGPSLPPVEPGTNDYIMP